MLLLGFQGNETRWLFIPAGSSRRVEAPELGKSPSPPAPQLLMLSGPAALPIPWGQGARGHPCCLWGQHRLGAFLKCSHTWGHVGSSRSLIHPGDTEGTFNSLPAAGARPGVTSPVQEKHWCLARAMPPPLQGAVGTRGCHHPMPGGCSQRAATSPRRPACFPG